MKHNVENDGRVIFSVTIENEEIVSVVETFFNYKIYTKGESTDERLVEVLGEAAMSLGGRKGALAVEEILRLAPKTNVPLINIKKYISDSGETHKQHIEEQIQKLEDEITELRNSMDVREVDWGI